MLFFSDDVLKSTCFAIKILWFNRVSMGGGGGGGANGVFITGRSKICIVLAKGLVITL